MNTLAFEIRIPEAKNVALTDDTLHVDLSAGRSISATIAWFPRLLHSSVQESNKWRLTGNGQGKKKKGTGKLYLTQLFDCYKSIQRILILEEI